MRDAVATLRSNGTLKDPPGEAVESTINSGSPLSVAMAENPDQFAREDVALVEAGEASGQLEQTLDRIALLEDERRRNRRALVTESWYPILLVHIAAVALPIAKRGMGGDLSGWMFDALVILGPLYLLFFLVLRLNRSAAWRGRFRSVVDKLPGFGSAALHRRRASFANVMEATYSAGIPMDRCLKLAGAAAHVEGSEEAAVAVAGGEQLTPAVTRTGLLGSTALSRLDTGERAGDLSGTLRAIAVEEGEQAREIFRRSMMTLGKGLYLFVALWIAWAVFSFYLKLYGL